MVVLVVLVAVLFAELASIVLVAGWVGGAATFGLLVLLFLAGCLVMRQAGRSWWAQLRASAGVVDAQGVGTPPRRPDGALAADRGLLFLAGLLLATPGFFGDLAALLLLVPFVRRALRALAATWFLRRFTAVRGPGGAVLWQRQAAGEGGVRVERVQPGTVVPGEVITPGTPPELGPEPPRPPA